MASGGQQNPSKGSLHSSENNTSNTGLGDNQWTFLPPPPNNLDLNSHPKPTKKHRNKEKIRSTTTPVSNSVSPTCVDHNSANSLTTHGFPHTKFTTASWLNDQLGGSGIFTKNEGSEADEQSSDVEHSINPRRNVKISVNQRLQSGRLKDHPLTCTQKDSVESENKKVVKEDNTKKVDTASLFERLRQLRECVLQVNYIMPSLEKSDEPRMIQQAETMKSIREDLLDKERLLQMHFLQTSKEPINELSSMIKKLTEEEKDNIEMLQHMLATDQSNSALNGVASTEPMGSKRFHRHRDTVHGDDEDKANIQNHFLEQVKESQEKLAALKQQQALLASWQKQAEDKLATFHAQLAKSNPDQVQSDLDCQYASSERSVHSGVVDDRAMNDDSEWENDVYQDPNFLKPSTNTQKLQNSGQEMLHPPVRQMDLQEQSNNEHRKPWSQVIQDLSDKNMSDPISDDDIEVTDVRKTLAEVEWKRKKLKNKLTELQEKKLLNDKLMVELSSLNEAAKCVGVGKFSEDEDTFSGSASHDNQHFGSIEEKKRKIEQLQNTLLQLRGMMDGISPAANPEVSSSSSSRRESKESTTMNFTVASSPRNIPVARKNREASTMKKDNISKEQCSGFPARRHYEAEGRANEDADVPSAVVASNPPAPEQNSWDNDPRIQEKIRKIQEAQSKLKKIQGLMNSIEESRRSGQNMPSDYLQLLQSLEDEVKTDGLNASNSEESDEDRDDDDAASINENCPQIAVVTSVKEIGDEKTKSLLPTDSRSEQSEQLHNQEKDLQSLINERERLLKIHEQYIQLQNSLPSLQRTNNDHVRSSGEGGNLQKKKPHRSNVQAPAKESHQTWIGRAKDNLLTRQNVATMESQTRNGSNTLRPSRESVMVKKENINNLSGKFPKHAPNSSVHSESLTQGNTDAFSTLSTELNRSLSLQDDFKLELNDIMVGKRQMYSSNQPSLVHSCSSVNSELEGSNSAIAPDNTIAATWGGSSTQDNFEDEGEEAIQSLEEQDDEDEDENHNGEAAKHVSEARQNITSLNHFPREGAYVDHVCSINEKARNNRNKGGIQTNRCSMKSNLPQSHNNNRSQIIFSGSRPEAYIPAEATTEPGELEPISAPASDSIMGPGLPSNFFQQVEQLNALCYSILEQQALPQNHQRNLFCPLPLPNSCRSTHPVPDVVHQYTQQLQLQQQLLLNLSQCYHALYVQQLEIQHLQRCMPQNSDPETSASGNATTVNAPVASTDDFTFRPWFLSPWLSSGIPSMPHAPSQVSPMSAPPFLQPPQQSFTFSPPAAASNSPPCTLVSGTPQTRTVASLPVDQELRPNPETLNNRVPPRTRANNFLDNFRSYTRQNLLSSPHNNTRSNEYNGTAAVTHTRQFPTSVSNSANWNCRAATEQIPNSENAIPASQSAERSSERPPANPDLQELMTRTKKFNLNKPQITSYSQNNPEPFRRPVASLNTLAPTEQVPRSNPVHALNLESFVPSNLAETSVNLAQPYPLQQKSKIGQFPSASIVAPPPPSSSSVHESIYSEVSKLVSKNEFQPGSLRDFFQELQNLRSDGLQKALKTVKEMVKTEKSGCSSAINDDKIKNNNNEQDHNIHDSAEQLPGSNHDSIDVAESRSNELHVHRPAVDASKQWNNHGLPTATIPPLSKTHVPKCSTGAVKKKASCKTAHACNFVSNIAHDSQDTNVTVSATNANLVRDSSELLVEAIAFDIIPYLQNRLLEDCCPSFRSKLSSRIMDVLKANYGFPLPCAFLLQLHQNLNLIIAKYSGLRVCDCESDLVKNVAEMLFKELTSYKSSLQRQLDNGDTSCVTSETSHQSDVMSQASKLTSINEKKRPGAGSKDVPEVSRADSNFTSAEVADDGLCDNLLKISVDDSSNSLQHQNGILQQEPVRGAVGGELPYVSHNSNWSIVTGNPEEDMGYECDPEAEAEPGVEAETEADLAEADQSPGPQGASSSSFVPEDVCQTDGLGTLSVATANNQIWKADGSLCSDEQAVADVGVDILQDTLASVEDAVDQEMNSDDTPARLTPPFSEEELQMHIKSEEDSNALLTEVVEDFTLAGDGFSIKEPVPHAWKILEGRSDED